jgi:hypothetical protein
MTQDEKITYGKLIFELHKQMEEANKANNFKKETELLGKLVKLKMINPEYFNQTIRLIK